MKHLNFLSNLLSLSLGSPCTDVSLGRRLTVGSPSGRYCSGLMRLVFILAILLTVGVGNVWGAIANPYSFTFSSGDLTTSSTSFTKGEVTWSLSDTENSWNGVAGKYGYLFGSAKNPKPLTVSTSGISGTITQVTVTGRSNNKDKTATVSVTVGSTDFTTTDDTWDNGDNQTLTFTGSASGTISIDISPDNCGHVLYGISVTYSAATTYSITYYLNGGSGTTPTETNKASGATFTLHNGTSSITAPTGKSFNKWKDQDDNLYSGGDTYTMPAKNVTLTAQWSCITPTISGHPAAATYWDMDSPSALTVTASGGTLSYQWQMSADGSSSWSNIGTNSSSYTPLVANGTKYYRCIVTNTGSSCNTTATSNNALVTIKTLSSIAVKTSPKTTYFTGETFSPTNLVITLTASDASTQDRSYASYSSGFTFSPTTATALTTSDDKVTITYGGEDVDLSINVYSVTVSKVDDAGNSVSAAGVTASWTVGTKALAASYGSTQYRFKEWAFDGSNNGLSITSTSSANTTVTGTPTGNVTIKAVFYAPRVVKWSVDGDDSYDTGSPTESVPYGTTWSALTLPTAPDPDDDGCGHKFVGWTTTENYSNATTAPTDLLNAGNKSGKTAVKITDNVVFHAVFADYDE